jgi:hypothetical protein
MLDLDVVRKVTVKLILKEKVLKVWAEGGVQWRVPVRTVISSITDRDFSDLLSEY